MLLQPPPGYPPVRNLVVVLAMRQVLKLLHFLAQRKCFLWDRGCIRMLFWGLIRRCQGFF